MLVLNFFSFFSAPSPIPLLVLQSFLDDQGLKEVTNAAKKILNAMNTGAFKLATLLWDKAEDIIEKVKR